MESFDYDTVQRLEREGIPYTGERTKRWWHRDGRAWRLETMDEPKRSHERAEPSIQIGMEAD